MKESSKQGYIMHEKADIKRIGNEVVVIDKNGKECFKRPYTEENISLAFLIYMGNKYEEIEQ